MQGVTMVEKKAVKKSEKSLETSAVIEKGSKKGLRERAADRKVATKKDAVIRAKLRFAPDPGAYATIDLNDDAEADFEPQHVALIYNESYHGCGVIVLKCKALKMGAYCRVQVGKLPPMLAEVKWRKELDREVARVGLQYIE